MTCKATLGMISRPTLVASGWECDGADLVVAVPAGTTLPPAVIRRDLIPYVDEATASIGTDSGWPYFPGGDHLHIRLPIPLRKPREECA